MVKRGFDMINELQLKVHVSYFQSEIQTNKIRDFFLSYTVSLIFNKGANNSGTDCK